MHIWTTRLNIASSIKDVSVTTPHVHYIFVPKSSQLRRASLAVAKNINRSIAWWANMELKSQAIMRMNVVQNLNIAREKPRGSVRPKSTIL